MYLITRNPATLPQVSGYGMLYNWYAATDALNISAADWRFPAKADLETFSSYVGISNARKVKLDKVGSSVPHPRWISEPDQTTNEYLFNATPSGLRGVNGAFSNIHIYSLLPSSDTELVNGQIQVYGLAFYYLSVNMSGMGSFRREFGYPIRLMRDATYSEINYAQEGEVLGNYTGNDGKTYPYVKIGTQIWINKNLEETKYRDGSDIPIVANPSTWAALTTGARCFYKNDIGWV